MPSVLTSPRGYGRTRVRKTLGARPQKRSKPRRLEVPSPCSCEGVLQVRDVNANESNRAQSMASAFEQQSCVRSLRDAKARAKEDMIKIEIVSAAEKKAVSAMEHA
jgi:hypothetical protein